VLGEQRFPPFPHLLALGDVLLLQDEIRRPLLQGGILRLEVFLGKRDVASPVIKLLLQLLQIHLSRGLLIPLLLQHHIIGFQLLMEFRDDRLPLGQVFFLLDQPLLLLGHLPLPLEHLLHVLLEVLTLLLKLGPLRSKLTGRGLATLLQLRASITKELVLSLERLPLPQDRCLGLSESLMSAGQHPREGKRRRFWPDAGLEPTPKNNLWLLRNGRRDGVGHAPVSSAIADGIFDDITAAVGSVVSVGGATATGPPAGAWGPDGAAAAVAVETWGPDDAASVVAGGT
jgi:hypothetical protein